MLEEMVQRIVRLSVLHVCTVYTFCTHILNMLYTMLIMLVNVLYDESCASFAFQLNSAVRKKRLSTN